jgi:hypothetical protein
MDDVKDLEKKATTQATTLKAKVDALQVTDQASYDLANQINKEAYDAKKAFHTWFDPIDEASKLQRKTTIAQGKAIDDPFDYIIQTTGTRSAKWMREQQAIAAKKQAEADELARKKAEDKQLEEAEMLSSLGMDEAADAALVAEPVIQRTVVEEPFKAAGTVLRDYYSAEVTDLMALVKAVAAGQAPLESVEANMPYLNGKARLEKGEMKVPGVRAVVESKQGRRG